MSRIAVCAVLLASGILGSPAIRAFEPEAAAQDRKKDDDKEKEKRERERKQREKKLKEIGGDFGTKSVSLLLNRVAKGEQIRLSLGDDDGDFSVDQARGVLEKYFEKFQSLSVEYKRADENVGSFTLKLRKSGENETKSRTLYVTIGPADAGYPLKKLVVAAR